MRVLVELADRAERNAVARESVNALKDGAYWGWAVALVAAVAVWVARGMPSPVTAAAAAVLIPVGVALAWWRTWRRSAGADPADRRAAAAITARRWATGYALAAVLIPAVHLAAADPVAGAVVAVAVVVALAELAIVTVPVRARWRLLARLRIGARAVAGEDDVRVGRAVWRGLHLLRVMITYPAEWGVHKSTRRDDLVERVMWELCGPPPATPDQAVRRPDYLGTWDHVNCRLIIERTPPLPGYLAARAWGQPPGTIVLGQTTQELADAVLHGVPVALYAPRRHMLVVGATQFGKSSGTRAWAVDGLAAAAFPAGLLAVLDGKGSGSFVALEGRQGVGVIAHTPAEWEHALVNVVMPEVDRRYEELLEYRRGNRPRPDHPPALVILDEIQQILAACPDLKQPVDRLGRQALEAGVILWVLTQRPDVRDTIPGAIRDQLDERVTFGPLSTSGAKMTFDGGDDWHRGMGVAPVRGRALARLGGRWIPLQAPWLPIPADAPDIEPLYPPRAAQRAAQPSPEHHRPADPWRGYGPPPPPTPPPTPPPATPRSTEPGRPQDRQPATWPPPPPQAPPRPAPIPQVEQIINDYGDGPAGGGQDAGPEYDPRTARRRRRRTD